MTQSLLWRPFDEEYIRDPYAMYKALREQDPVHVAQTKELIISKYVDVKAILKDERFVTGNTRQWLDRGIAYLAEKGDDLTTIQAAINSFLLLLNPPQQTQIRNFVSKAWSNRDVDSLIEENIKQTISTLGKDFDAITDFADAIPVQTICDILGIETTDYRYLKGLGGDMLRALELYPSLRHLVAINEASKAFIEFFKDLIAIKSQIPDDGLLSRMIEKNKREKFGLSEQQLISIGIFLFVAGEETTSALIGNGIATLLLHREQLKEFQNDPTVHESAVEEIIRFHSPVQLLGRIAEEDVEVRGKLIPKSTSITLAIGSANRDEDVFKNPDTFDIHRTPNRHLGFGSGIHFCLGDWLGRRQAQLAIPAFFQRFTNPTLTTPSIAWSKRVGTRKPEALPLTVAG